MIKSIYKIFFIGLFCFFLINLIKEILIGGDTFFIICLSFMLILSLYFYVLVMYKTVSTIKKEQELVVFYTFSQKKFSYLLDDIKTVRLNSRGGSITFYDGTKLNLLTSLYVIEDQQGKNRRNLNENDFPNADFIKTI